MASWFARSPRTSRCTRSPTGPLHVDFLRLSKDAKITVQVPVVFINEEASPGLKKGGVLNVVRHELELVCESDRIPDEIELDVTGLDIGDSIHISHVTLPEGSVSAITDRDFTIATVVAPSAMKQSDADDEAAAAAPAEGAAPKPKTRLARKNPKAEQIAPPACGRGGVGLRWAFVCADPPRPSRKREGRRCNSGSASAIPVRNMRCTGTTSASWRSTSWPRCMASARCRRSSRAGCRKGASGQWADSRVLLFKPATFMNESGRAVAEALRFYKLEMDALTCSTTSSISPRSRSR
jgi:hypothetical protein